MKYISILGATGSIGVSTLNVIAHNPSRFHVVALTGGRNVALLREQIQRFRPRVAAVIDSEHAETLKESLGGYTGTEILYGIEGYREAAAVADADMVVSAMVGAAGLLPTIEAIDAGKDIALANKETMVMAGDLVIRRAESRHVRIVPVDSEHSAVFQCLEGHRKEDVRRIILTASGGPFREMPAERLAHVSVQDALNHPTWNMGTKITIDSASMMNKGLEVIEARWLFGMDAEHIDIVIHPQSIVHSMVEYLDGTIIAQLGIADMRIPIAYALAYPERVTSPERTLDICRGERLEFFAPDYDKFPNLRHAREALRRGGTMPAVMNAANEEAVDGFVGGTIKFTDMPLVVERVMNAHAPREGLSVEEILAADAWARSEAQILIERMHNESC